MRNTTVRSASLLGGAQAGNGRFEALDTSRCLTHGPRGGQRGVRLLGGSEVAAERFADQLRSGGSLGLGPLK